MEFIKHYKNIIYKILLFNNKKYKQILIYNLLNKFIIKILLI